MYAPRQFREERRDVLIGAIRDVQLAAVVTPGDDGLCATHAPVVVREDGDHLILETHVARPNPHWKLAGARSLMIFQGPQAYIHPGWYESKAEHGKVVPTWAYVAVHAHGPLTAFDAEDELLVHLAQLTSQNEAAREQPWDVSDAPQEFIKKLTRAIVGLRMTVERLEGSWKLNQHKPDGDRQGVTAGLSSEENSDSKSISALMRELESARVPAAKR
ncbi:transcriptional regulator [Phyllobacterium phragmitis]|uniref:Transcriptional regulator n=1 Tax=Phyllobacterium phragmitis TaxID=2670329 RepID=A0A2S9IKG7_9HYPH|nr:FMN-binding negative transcriptional regulator [Phyllobacterium phragmitis]PRD41020.1 transcriptional regulator [Phyllobacterium phragmitis]